jgi:hypothetical protein
MDADLVGFLPSTHGLHYPNDWPSVPVMSIPIRFDGLGQHLSTVIPLGDASRGLCGGMVFAVRDLFEQRLVPPPDTENPPPGSPAFDYLCRRLLASLGDLDGGGYGLRFLEWMLLPDRIPAPLPALRRGVADLTLQHELRAARALIDSGHPAPLGLVCERMFPGELSAGLRKLSANHQVLAFAYEADDAQVVLRLYDPNHPDRDDMTLTCRLHRAGDQAFGYSDGEHTVRGFFLSDYRHADPSDLFTTPVS